MNLNFAENIKKLRKSKEITQEKLAEVLGVTGQTVSRWELGICYPDLELLPSIANFFGVSIDMLLSNDASAKEKDAEVFHEKLNSFSVERSVERIKFVKEYCCKYPEDDYYACMLAVVIQDHLLTKPEDKEQYMPLMLSKAQGLLETRYRYDVIVMMAILSEDAELKKWLDMCPYSSFSKRECLLSRAEARGSAYEMYVQGGLGMFETFARQLDWRCADSLGANIKEVYQRKILDTIRSFGTNGEVPDGWKMFYAYKQFVLAACLFGQKKMEEGWENFNAALEKCKYIHSLKADWLDIGGPLFSNLKVSRDWNCAIDEKGQIHKLFRLVNLSHFDMGFIHHLLSNPKWAWFNAVRETDQYQAALKWIEENEIKPEDLAEIPQ